MDLLRYLDARLGEPSTYASLAVMLTAMHVSVDPGVWHQVTLWGAVLAGALGVLLREYGSQPTKTVASDVLNQIVTGIKTMPPVETPNNGAST